MEKEANILFQAGNDRKAEFFAASYLEAGLLPEQIIFRPLGPFKRRSHNDIEAADEKEIGHFRGTVIESNRSGIYDYLPEQLFHLSSSKTGKDLKRKIQDIQEERKKEQKTRLFFLPLEQEFFFSKVRLTQTELHASALDADSALLEELRYFWKIPSFVYDETFRQLLPLLPTISECRADFQKSEIILSEILNVPVQIESSYGTNPVTMQGSAIGNAFLGADLILGGALDANLPALQINIFFEDTDTFEQYFCDPVFERTVHWLSGWLLPVEFDYKINLLVPANAMFLTAGPDAASTSRLGYTTTLAI